MKIASKPKSELKTFRIKQKNFQTRERVFSEVKDISIKFYQKVFLVLISLSLFLIFPESPKEMELVCHNHYSKQICNVW